MRPEAGARVRVSEDGSQLKAVNLKNLATNGSGAEAEFDPEDPYYQPADQGKRNPPL